MLNESVLLRFVIVSSTKFIFCVSFTIVNLILGCGIEIC
jgi:hypothetical protein